MKQLNKPDITVLTDPLPVGLYFFSELTRGALRKIKFFFKKKSNNNQAIYRGHPSVTRSLINGLKKNDINFNYNPKKITLLSDTVIVLAGVRTLRQALSLKRALRIKKLFAGPNIVNFSTDFNSILASKEIDGVVTPSKWVADSYLQDAPSLEGKLYPWPAGVDIQFFLPSPQRRADKIIIYHKDVMGFVGSMQPYVNYLEGHGYKVNILKYSGYNIEDYLSLLQESCLLIGFTRSESQGIAWAEAWAMDVPTLIWRNDQEVIQGKLLNTSTAPYLCDRNGLFFDNFEHFKEQFCYWSLNKEKYSPRDWILENMSDEVSAKCLYRLIKQC